MRTKLGVAMAAVTLGLTLGVGGGVAGAHPTSQTYHGRWTTTNEVCGPDVERPAAPSSGTWKLALKRDGTGTFAFDYRRDDWPADMASMIGTIPVVATTTRPLTVTGTFVGGFGPITMNVVIHPDDIVMAATTAQPCEGTPYVLTPVFTGTTR